MVAAINKIIRRIKGENYTIDNNISSAYLIFLLYSRGLMLVRGKLSFVKNNGMFFIGGRTQIHAKHLIKVGRSVSIAANCYIDALSREGIVFGDNVSMAQRTVIECSGSLKFLGKGLIVGSGVGLGRDCFYGCAGGIEIGQDTIIGNFVSFHSENHNAGDLNIPIRLQGVNHKGIKIGSNCWIGAKVTVLDGVDLGSGCIVAAGAVLKAGSYEPNTIYGGVPAKIIKKR